MLMTIHFLRNSLHFNDRKQPQCPTDRAVSLLFLCWKHFVSSVETICFFDGNTLFLLLKQNGNTIPEGARNVKLFRNLALKVNS